MTGTFKFELVSPERVLLAADAEQVVVPGAEGDFAVLADHAPVISTLRPGVLEVSLPGSKRRMFVKSGFAQVEPTRLTVLAQQAFDVDELGAQDLARELAAAEAGLSEAKDDEARRMSDMLVAELKRLQSKAA